MRRTSRGAESASPGFRSRCRSLAVRRSRVARRWHRSRDREEPCATRRTTMTRTKNIGWHTWTVALIGAAAMASGCTKDDDPGIPAPTDASSEAKSDAAGGDSAADGAHATTAHFAIPSGADITCGGLTAAVKLLATDLDCKSAAVS